MDKLEKVSRVAFPVRFAPLTMEVKPPKEWLTDKSIRAVAKKFGLSLKVAEGLIKDMQGPVTLFFHRAAKLALLKLYDVLAPHRDELLVAVRLTKEDLLFYTTEQISVYIHQFFAEAGEACMTEVLMDLRKYSAGDPDRYEAALQNLADLIAGRVPLLDPKAFVDGEGNRIHKGETTVNVEVFNALIQTLCGESLNRSLAAYPINNALIGKLNSTKTVALCHSINDSSMISVMDIIHSRKIEKAVPVAPFVTKDRKPRSMPRGYGMQKWYDNTAKYTENAIAIANVTKTGDKVHDILVKVDKYSIEVVYLHESLPTIHINGYGKVNGVRLRAVMPDLQERDTADHEVGGFYLFQSGEAKSFARNGIICLNRKAGMLVTDEASADKAILPSDLRLVTVMDFMAHEVISFLDTLYAAVWHMSQGGLSFSDSWTKQMSREFRTTLSGMLQKYVRPIGEDHHDDGITYDTVDMLPLQASLEGLETKDSQCQMIVKKRLMAVVDSKTFDDPLRPGVKHNFCVGASPKGGSAAHITVAHGDTNQTLIELVSQPGQYNRERGQREASGNATAWVLTDPHHTIRTIWDGLLPEILDRCTDLIIAYVGSEGLTTNGLGKNPDSINLTPQGVHATRYTPKHAKYGPMSRETANAKAVEFLGKRSATTEDLKRAGWKVSITYRQVGTLDAGSVGKFVPGANQGIGKDVIDGSTEEITLVSPDVLPCPKGRKLGWCGTKSVGVPNTGSRYFIMGGRRVYVHVVAAIDSMEQKKLTGDVIIGQGALMGHTHFDGTQTAMDIEDHLQDLKDVVSPKSGTIITRLFDGFWTQYVSFVLYDEDGNNCGSCIPALHRTFVLKENEDLAYTTKKDGMSQSPWATNLFGGQITMSADEMEVMEMLAKTISQGARLKERLREEKEAALRNG